jgi:formamidopyrimidine-DNA glycosylase
MKGGGMPELPEVEVIRRDLEKEVVGRRFKDVQIRPGTNAMKVVARHGRRKELQDLLEGAKVEKIDRLGKRLLLELDTKHVFVLSLQDAGQLLKTSASDPIEAHTHLVLGFTIGGQLRFLDPVKSSEVFVIPSGELDLDEGLHDFKIDPLEHQFTWQYFSTVLDGMEAPLKDLLVDEKFIVGLGDIYSDEILWGAGMRYDHMSNKLSSQDVRRLYRALMEILQEAVKARGTSIGEHPFRDLHGVPGTFQLELKVYQREGEACRRCRSAIVKEKYRDGFTYLCAQCQS